MKKKTKQRYLLQVHALLLSVIIYQYGCTPDSVWYPKDESIEYDSLFASADPDTDLITEIRILDGVKYYRQASYFSDGNICCVFPMAYDTFRVHPTKLVVILDYYGTGYCLSPRGDTLNKQTFSSRGEAEKGVITDYESIVYKSLIYPKTEFEIVRMRFITIERKELYQLLQPAPEIASKNKSFFIVSTNQRDTIFNIIFDRFGCLDSIPLPDFKYFTFLSRQNSESKRDTVFFCLPTPQEINLTLRPIEGSSVRVFPVENFASNDNYYTIDFEKDSLQDVLQIEISLRDSCDNTSSFIDTLTVPIT